MSIFYVLNGDDQIISDPTRDDLDYMSNGQGQLLSCFRRVSEAWVLENCERDEWGNWWIKGESGIPTALRSGVFGDDDDLGGMQS